MKGSYRKMSLDQFMEEDSSFINFAVIPEHGEKLSNLSFNEPVIMEGAFFALCIKGTADIRINSKEYHISPDTIMVIQPGQLIHVTNKSDNFLVESLYVSIDFFIEMSLFRNIEYYINVISKYPCIQISKQTSQNLLEYYSFIVKRYNRDSQKYNDNIIQGLLYSLIMEYIAIYNIDIEKEEHKYSKRQEEITDNFFNLLQKHCSTERSVAFYADKLCITSKYLSSSVKLVTGRSVLEWIHDIFIINSKMLLKNTNKTISEICDTLNVQNDSFFCRFFKEQTGMSPLQYRNSA